MIKNTRCRMCPSQDFRDVIDMGDNPLVNSLISQENIGGVDPVFPLVVRQCQNCHLVQLTDFIDGQEIYRDQDYLYYSGDMPGLAEYFEEYANYLKLSFLDENDLVVEIGSNDGTMLGYFDEQNILGVDPSTNVVIRAIANGIPTISDFFTERTAENIRKEFGSARIIYGNNCIAHLNDLDDLMRGVARLLDDGGIFVVECNYWGAMVKNKNYALIYHDHFSYFSLKNWIDFAPKYGLHVFDATVTPAQGGSLRVFMEKGKSIRVTERMTDLCGEELADKLNSYETCVSYRNNVVEEAKKLGDLVGGLREDGKRIAGYGAAAKGFSVLKLAGIDERHIEYFVDDSPAKQGKFTPVSHIPVISRREADKILPDYFFITAPNYEKVIIGKESEFAKNGGKFITVDSRIL